MVMTAQRRADLTLVELEGPRLDAASSPTVKAELRQLIDDGAAHIVIDFGRIQFIDSSGLGVLVGCLKYMGCAGRMEIARPGEAVMKVLRLTRMDKVFKLRDLPIAG